MYKNISSYNISNTNDISDSINTISNYINTLTNNESIMQLIEGNDVYIDKLRLRYVIYIRFLEIS